MLMKYVLTAIGGFLLFFSATTYSQSHFVPCPDSGFVAPLDIPLYLSGNYGEFRSGHFHSGIDFKTQQVEGKNVLAADSGYVFRIAVLLGGYGNVLYMKHPNGNITVYGHLSRFEPGIARYVKEQQYKKKSFTVDLLPDTNLFVFHKGEQIAFSGNSGGSAGPHLHFEIRDRSGNIPVNPLRYGFAVADHTPPVIKMLAVYPMNPESHVNRSHDKMLFPLTKTKEGYNLDGDTIAVFGDIGLGIEAYDYLDNTPNECGTYNNRLKLDDQLVYWCRIDSIPFSDAGYIESFYDYDEMMRSVNKIQKMFIDPNDRLKIFKDSINKGILHLTDSHVHRVKITADDSYGNTTGLSFFLRAVSAIKAAPDTDNLTVARFNFTNQQNVFENSEIRVAIPGDALFNNLNFEYHQEENDSIPLSAIHHVHNAFTPLFKSYTLSIKPRNIPSGLGKKLLIARRTNRGWVAQGGEYKNGFVTTQTRMFGDFIVALDTTPPVIVPETFITGSNYSDHQTITFHIDDSFSGIRKYTATIDKRWALFEYDPKNDRISYAIDPEKLSKNESHTLEITVTDSRNNVTTFKSYFYY
jgi:hypothetical protein